MGFRIAVEDELPARTLDVRAARTTVGRSDACRLRVACRGVARMHAVVRHDDGAWLIEAVGRSELRVDEQLVTCAVLRPGSVIAMGRARLRVLDVTPGVDPAPAPRAGGGAGTIAGLVVAAGGPAVQRRTRAAVRAVVGSVAAHLGLLAILWLVGLFDPRPAEDPVELAAVLAFDVPALRGEEEPPPPLSPEPPPEPPAPPPAVDRAQLPDVELSFPEPEIRENPFPEPPPPEPRPEPAQDAEPAPVAVRTEAGTVAVAAPKVPARSFGKNEADGANRQAADILTGDRAGAAALAGVRGKASSASIVVIRGDYDEAEKTLDVLGISHALVAKEALERAELPAGVRALIYNCTGKPMPADVQRRIAEWVAAGGHLITTDWGVERLLEKGLPGTLAPLRRGGRHVMTPDETVEVQPVASGSALLAGVPTGGEAARWWLEDTSLPFEAAEGLEIDVLVRSDSLDRRHGSPMVAAAFPYGRGRVLHLLGHLHQKEGNLRGAYMVQRILVNFLAEALR